MQRVGLSGKRALVLGAETPVGKALAMALAEAGAAVAVVAATTDAAAAFAVQRLARRIAASGRRSLGQAIEATNEMAVRVMTRQVSKALGGLDALLFCAELGEGTAGAATLACRFATREMAPDRGRGGTIVIVGEVPEGVEAAAREHSAQRVGVRGVTVSGEPDEGLVEEVLEILAGS